MKKSFVQFFFVKNNNVKILADLLALKGPKRSEQNFCNNWEEMVFLITLVTTFNNQINVIVDCIAGSLERLRGLKRGWARESIFI